MAKAYWRGLQGTQELKSDLDFYQFHSIERSGGSNFRPDPQGYKNAYLASVWAYRCITIRAKAIAGIPLSFSENDIPLPDKHPLVKTLGGRNSRLLRRTEANLLIWGAAYWRPAYTDRELKVYDLNPQTIEQVKDRHGIQGFIQRIDGQIVAEYEPGELIYFADFDPDDDLGGLPPTHWVLNSIGLDQNIERFAISYFENDATPAGLLVTEQDIQETDAERIADRFRQMFRGAANKFKTAVLGRGATYQAVTPPLNDLALETLDSKVKRRIAGAYGVPTTIALMDDAANFATAHEQRKGFYTETILPEIDLILDVINSQLCPLYGDRVSVDVEQDKIEALAEDRTVVTTRATSGYLSGVMSLNEARELQGLPPLEVDNYYIPNAGLVKAADLSAGKLPAAPAPATPPGPGGGLLDMSALSGLLGSGASDTAAGVKHNPFLSLTAAPTAAAPPAPGAAKALVELALADLTRWKSKVKKRGPAARFDPDALAPAFAADIADRLAAGDDPALVFDAAKEQVKGLTFTQYAGAGNDLITDVTDEEFNAFWSALDEVTGESAAAVARLLEDTRPLLAAALLTPSPADEEAIYADLAARLSEVLGQQILYTALLGTVTGDRLLSAALVANGEVKATPFDRTRPGVRPSFGDSAAYGRFQTPNDTGTVYLPLDQRLQEHYPNLRLKVMFPEMTPERTQEALESSFDRIGENFPFQIRELWHRRPDGMTIDEFMRRLSTGENISDIYSNVLLPEASTGRTGLASKWDITLQQAADYARTKTNTRVTQITSKTKKELQALTSDWIQAGGTLPELAEAIQGNLATNAPKGISPKRLKWFTSPERAFLIAQTETTDAYAQGVKTRWQANGVKLFRWRTQNDRIVCPLCRRLHNKEGELKQGVFDRPTGAYYVPPSHPGCRCFMAPVMSSDPAEKAPIPAYDEQVIENKRANQKELDRVYEELIGPIQTELDGLQKDWQQATDKRNALKLSIRDQERELIMRKHRGEITFDEYSRLQLELSKEYDDLYDAVLAIERQMKEVKLKAISDEIFTAPDKQRLKDGKKWITRAKDDSSAFINEEYTAGLVKNRAKQGIEQSAEFYNEMIGNRPDWNAVPIGFRVQTVKQKEEGYYRAFYHPGRRDLNMGPVDPTWTYIHEIGHHLEHNVPGLNQKIQAYLKHRGQGKPIRKLKDMKPNSNYRENEIAYEGAFGPDIDLYASKLYLDHTGEMIMGSTEVFTMGVQYMFQDPVKFALADKDYFQFIYGILSGIL